MPSEIRRNLPQNTRKLIISVLKAPSTKQNVGTQILMLPITHQERYTSVHDRKASFVLMLITSQHPVQTTKSDITVSAVSFFFLIFQKNIIVLDQHRYCSFIYFIGVNFRRLAVTEILLDKQQFTKHTYKTKDRVTRTPLGCTRLAAASCLPMVGGSLRVLRLPPPLKLVAMIQLKYC